MHVTGLFHLYTEPSLVRVALVLMQWPSISAFLWFQGMEPETCGSGMIMAQGKGASCLGGLKGRKSAGGTALTVGHVSGCVWG